MRILRWTTHHKVWGIDSRRVISDNLTFRLNHYPVMSRDYFQRIKMTRGDVSAANADSVRTMDYFEKYDRPAVVRDTLLADMVRRSRGEQSLADETGAHSRDETEIRSGRLTLSGSGSYSWASVASRSRLKKQPLVRYGNSAPRSSFLRGIQRRPYQVERKPDRKVSRKTRVYYSGRLSSVLLPGRGLLRIGIVAGQQGRESKYGWHEQL